MTAAGEAADERDESRPGRAAPLRTPRPPADPDELAPALAADIGLVRAFYAAAIDTARRDTPKAERAAAIKALRQQMKDAIRALTKRNRAERASRRAAARRERQEQPRPTKA